MRFSPSTPPWCCAASPRRRAPGSCGPPAASSRESIACWASWSGTMACSRPVAGGRERGSLPDRWSTRRGAFLAKAAAGVIGAAAVVPGVSAPVVEAAERTLAASLRWLDERPHREVHPLLYAAEGFLSLPAHPLLPAALPVIARELAEVLRQSRALGRVPEFLDVEPTAAGAARLDIVAQTLRVAALLAANGVRESLDAAELLHLRRLLVDSITPDREPCPSSPGRCRSGTTSGRRCSLIRLWPSWARTVRCRRLRAMRHWWSDPPRSRGAAGPVPHRCPAAAGSVH